MQKNLHVGSMLVDIAADHPEVVGTERLTWTEVYAPLREAELQGNIAYADKMKAADALYAQQAKKAIR